MPDTTSTTDLRKAAERLRELSTAVIGEDWGTRPWHTEDCSDTDTMEPCPCIVAQGEYKEFDQPQIPPVQYVADAETTEHAAYIAAMHPGVAIALATWLDTEALTWSGDEVHNSCSPATCTLDAAMTVARLVLGTTAQQPEDESDAPK